MQDDQTPASQSPTQVAAPDFVSDDQVPVEAAPQKQEAPDFIPDDHAPAAAAPDFVSDKDVPRDTTVDAGFEGFARGITGGLSDVLAGGMRKAASKLGVSDENLHYIAPAPEDLAQHKQDHPYVAAGSEIAGSIPLWRALPAIGGKAISSMIKMGVISGGDEMSKAALGQGDPAPMVAAHIAGSSALGLLTGGVGGKLEGVASKGLKAVEAQKIGSKIPSFMAGIGHSLVSAGEAGEPSEQLALQQMKHIPEGIVDKSAFNAGKGIYKKGMSVLKNGMTSTAMYGGYKTMGPLGGVVSGPIEKGLEKLLSPVARRVSQKLLAPMVLKAASSGTIENLGHILDHAETCSAGANAIGRGVESVFNTSVDKAADNYTPEKNREKLKKYIDEGGINQSLQTNQQNMNQESAPGFAAGGQVPPVASLSENDEIAKHWPEQNVLINAAKARISNYLSTQKPLPAQTRFPYETEHKDKQKERAYDQALDLANNPLSVMKKIRAGTLVPKDMQHFSGMFPELRDHLSHKLTERILRGKERGDKKPPYHVRQSLSLFMGQEIDATLTQPNMMAAQQVFMNQKAQAPAGNKADLSKMGSNTMTAEQSREKRLNKS